MAQVKYIGKKKVKRDNVAGTGLVWKGKNSVVDVYQNDPTFKALRDPSGFNGKCGVCEYREPCGGSRARAYAVYGDPLGSEPDCIYEP